MMAASSTFKNGNGEDASVWSALSLAWELGYLIAIPALLFGIGGAYLDKKFATSPLLIILGFVIAFSFSGFAIYRKVKEITREQSSDSDHQTSDSSNKPTSNQ